MRSFGATQIKRAFSCVRANLPPFVAKEFNDFHQQYGEKVNHYPSADSTVRIADNLISRLQEEAINGCEESQNTLGAINGFRTDNGVTSLFLTGGPTIERSLFYLSEAISYLTGFKPQSSNRSEYVIDPKQQGFAEVPLHTDGFYLAGYPPLDMATLLGIESKGNYRTYAIELKDVLDVMSEKSKNILEQPIFKYGPKENPIFSPILYKADDEDYRVSFRNEGDEEWNLSRVNKDKLNISDDDVSNAIKEIREALTEVVKKGKVESFYIKSGESLFYKNSLTFHARDQEGVPEEMKDIKRVVVSDSYTSVKQTPSADKITLLDEKTPVTNLSTKDSSMNRE